MNLLPAKCSLSPRLLSVGLVAILSAPLATWATPSNKAALERYYEKFLSKELNRCTTCHLPSDIKDPESLEDFPHNPFGDRLRVLGGEWAKEGKRKDVATRLAAIAREDADRDGIDNESEVLLGFNPGDDKSTPTTEQMGKSKERAGEFAKFLASYRWRPFDRVQRPAIPQPTNTDWLRTPIDAFVAAEHEARGLKPRPAATKAVLLRRVYLDLIGLSPTPAEQQAFENDHSSDAYEKVVDRLLADSRYGERWGRHWMDVWRYSDWAGWTDGKQVRDSQRHIWRWRDWIVDALNSDRGYDRMVTEMLAGDELAPEDPNTLRATGFLVRNYKMLSREQWLEDTVKHTSQAFLGITLGCAKCHDHRADPISQAEYYQVRAVFEPHQVRTDRVPGELDRAKDGMPRVYDVDKESPTYFLVRGDERKPDKDRLMKPGVPKALCADRLKPDLEVSPVKLPRIAAFPDKQEFVIKDTIADGERSVSQAADAFAKAKADATIRPELLTQRELESMVAEGKHASLLAELRTEQLEDEGKKESEEWTAAAKDAFLKQNRIALFDAQLGLHKANTAQADAQRRLDEATKTPDEKAKGAALEKIGKELEAVAKKTAEAASAVAKAAELAKTDPTTAFKPRPREDYPTVSTGRRLAFARWIANPDNPLTARVAVNHLWLRHFGRGIAATPENLGNDGARPTHPALLDWLAAEFMANGWQMKAIHRMIVTSNAYRMSSTPDNANAAIDPDNIFLWRSPTRRMEAELVRDNLLYVCGSLDLTAGGPDIDNMEGLKSRRRSIYLRCAAEKEVEFLKIFDGPSVNECYQRHPTVMPQQSLALANGELTLAQSKHLATELTGQAKGNDEAFVRGAYQRVLARIPHPDELAACLDYLRAKAAVPVTAPTEAAPVEAPPSTDPGRLRENLVLVLFNHNDFVTIR